MAKNIEYAITDSILTITIDLRKNLGRSKSGKSLVIASTEGNQVISTSPDIYMGVNVYKKG